MPSDCSSASSVGFVCLELRRPETVGTGSKRALSIRSTFVRRRRRGARLARSLASLPARVNRRRSRGSGTEIPGDCHWLADSASRTTAKYHGENAHATPSFASTTPLHGCAATRPLLVGGSRYCPAPPSGARGMYSLEACALLRRSPRQARPTYLASSAAPPCSAAQLQSRRLPSPLLRPCTAVR